MSKRQVIIGTAATAAAIAAAVLVAVSGQGSGAQSAQPRPPGPARVAGPPELARFLRTYPVARGAPPAPRALAALIASSGAVAAREMRHAVRVRAAEPIWIVYGSRVVCVVQARSGAFSCETTQRALSLGVSLGTIDPGRGPHRFRLLGLAPAWARTVVFGAHGRPLRRIEPRNGVYAFRAGRPMHVLRYER
jgi:hypothetical protein